MRSSFDAAAVGPLATVSDMTEPPGTGRGRLRPTLLYTIAKAARSRRGTRPDAFRPDRRAACDPGRRARVRRGGDGAPLGALGRGEDLSRRRDAPRRPARLRRRLCGRGVRRLGPVAARRHPHLRGAGLRRRDDRGLPVDPQHGGGHDRAVRLRRPAPAAAARALLDGADRELLPDGAGLGIGCGEPAHHRPPRRRPLCAERVQGLHLRRRDQRRLHRHGPHGRGGAEGRLRHPGREGRARPVLRRPGEEDGLERPAHRAW